MVEDAAIKERNPKAWALTSGGSIYISDSVPAELADVVGFHETVHAAKQKENPQYLDMLENSEDYINYQNDRAKQVLDVVLQARFPGMDLADLSQDQMNTIFDELNAVVWGYHKADLENARAQFADMFQDYDAYIADLDAAMESGAAEDGDVRYSVDEDTAAEPPDNPPPSPDQSGRSDLHRPRGMSDEQYNRLNERWKNRPVDRRETLVPEGFDSIDDYTAALEAAAEERMRNRSRDEFKGSDALKNLGIRIANSVGLYGNTQQLIENDRAAKSVRKEIKRAERRLQATDAEKNFASGVAAGIYGEADIPPSMDADTVMELADYYWAENPPKEFQQMVFRRQLELALELELPVIVHDREAHGDSLEIVKEFPGVRGVFHCFSGSPEMAEELLKRGWYLGFDGPVTYKNARRAPEVVAVTPLDRIVVETDAPYMSPVPNRGRRNDSRNLPYIVEKLAEWKGISPEEMAAHTWNNGLRLFGLEGKV